VQCSGKFILEKKERIKTAFCGQFLTGFLKYFKVNKPWATASNNDFSH